MKRVSKGFTLVELLAVIVILAIIMLIAIPAVLNTLTAAKRKSFVEYVDKIFLITQKQVVEEETMGNPVVGCKTYYIKKDLGLTSTGSYDGYVLVKNDGFNDIAYYITLHDDEYKVESYLYDGSLDTENLEYYNSEDEVDNMLACASAGCSSCSMDGDVSATEVCSSITQVNDSNPGSFAGSGTQNDPYKLESIEDLVALSKGTNDGSLEKNKYYKLMVDLSFACDKSYVDPSGTSFGDINGDGETKSIKEELTSSLGWVPIGLNYSQAFSSSFDGNNKKIYGLYMNSGRKYENSGLFGYLYFSETDDFKFYLKNISLLDSDIKAEGYYNSALVGAIKIGVLNSKIENVKLSGNMTCSSGSCGGVVGFIDSYRSDGNSDFTVTNCINKMNINGNSYYSGGIVGRLMYNMNLSNSYNYGTIFGKADTGGIVGSAENGHLSNLYNYGKISANNTKIGGVIGYSWNVLTIDKIYNYGEVTLSTSGSSMVGGAIGEAGAKMITNIYNYGKVTSDGGWTGGAFGYLYYSKAYNVYNYGDIYISKLSTNGYNGGIAGYVSSSDLYNAGNHGNIYSDSYLYLGGITGWSSGKCDNVYNYGKITVKKSSNINYIAGLIAYGSCTNCYNIADIDVSYENINESSNEMVGLIIGYYSDYGEKGGNSYAVGTISNKTKLSKDPMNYFGGVLGGYSPSMSNVYAKVNYLGYKKVGIYAGSLTSSNEYFNNIYVDMYTDAENVYDVSNETPSGPFTNFYGNFNNSPNKQPFKVAQEYDFSQVNGTWFRDTLKLGNSWQYSDGYYPKLYKVLPNGSVSSELVEGQKDIPIK